MCCYRENCHRTRGDIVKCFRKAAPVLWSSFLPIFMSHVSQINRQRSSPLSGRNETNYCSSDLVSVVFTPRTSFDNYMTRFFLGELKIYHSSKSKLHLPKPVRFKRLTFDCHKSVDSPTNRLVIYKNFAYLYFPLDSQVRAYEL